MPARLHEDLLRLFQNRPALAAELAREALHAELPDYSEVRLDSENLSQLRPAQYLADLVILLGRHNVAQDDAKDVAPGDAQDIASGNAQDVAYAGAKDVVHGIIVEVQLHRDKSKPFVWPAYVCNLRNRIRSPVCLMVMAADESVARWASRSIDLGGGNRFTPWVLGPDNVPEVTDEIKAKEDPELAILSAVAHGGDADAEKAMQIARVAEAALRGLDTEREALYRDMLDQALSEVARRALQSMNPAKYEYRGPFAKHHYGRGLSAGEAKGRAELVLRQLSLRFGALPETAQESLRGASIEELDRIGEQLLTASTLDEALAAR
jgi:Domain of unknown function (DUF4351)